MGAEYNRIIPRKGVLFTVKGINRRVVIMKNTGSEYFDEAYFLVRENALKGKRTPVYEAKKLLRELKVTDTRSERYRWVLIFLSGVILGVMAGLLF